LKERKRKAANPLPRETTKGETPLHDMGVDWWERAQATWKRGKEMAAEAWKATKERWRDFVRDQGSGKRWPDIER
jgi:hypothetical protein